MLSCQFLLNGSGFRLNALGTGSQEKKRQIQNCTFAVCGVKGMNEETGSVC